MEGRLEQTYAGAVPAPNVPRWAAPAPQPRTVLVTEGLARDLDLDPAELAARPEVLAGGVDDTVPTFAQAYAGHRFGGYSPQLGDGRALLLGATPDQVRYLRAYRLPFAPPRRLASQVSRCDLSSATNRA